jgi:hypothetical protein
VQVRIDADEPEAVLAILRDRRNGQTPSADDWSRLFAMAGYQALKRREAAMQRAFTDEDFRAFVRSDTLLQRADALERRPAVPPCTRTP